MDAALPQPETHLPPRQLPSRPIPHGGSKWARCFAGPARAPIAEAKIITTARALCDLDGTASLAPGIGEPVALPVFALPAGAAVPMGCFLDGPLPYFWGAAAQWPQALFAGRAPTPVQLAILDRLGLADRLLRLEAPKRFSEVLHCKASPGILAGPEYFAMISRLREVSGPGVPFAVAILPSPSPRRFALSNRASLSAWLRARRFTLLAPEADAFERTARLLGQASFVLLADDRDAGLLGLCGPGAKILEIAPEGWATLKIRTLCNALGLRWELFLASAPSYPLTRKLSFGATAAMSYDVPISVLGQVLRWL